MPVHVSGKPQSTTRKRAARSPIQLATSSPDSPEHLRVDPLAMRIGKRSELLGIGRFLHSAKFFRHRQKRQTGFLSDAIPFRNFPEPKDRDVGKIWSFDFRIGRRRGFRVCYASSCGERSTRNNWRNTSDTVVAAEVNKCRRLMLRKMPMVLSCVCATSRAGVPLYLPSRPHPLSGDHLAAEAGW